jgi:hypothetical protein
MEQSLIGQETTLRLLQALCFVWVGLVFGISFLEAPVKFTAPSVTRAIGLDVGRHVFWALNRVELGLAAGALGLLLVGETGSVVRWLAAGVGIVLVIQTLWLLPVLRSQAAAIISGEIEHASEYVHLGYIVLEALKIAGLAGLGWYVAP